MARIWGEAVKLSVCHWGFVSTSFPTVVLFGGPGDEALAWDSSLGDADMQPGSGTVLLGACKTLLGGLRGQKHFHKHGKACSAFFILLLSWACGVELCRGRVTCDDVITPNS